MPTTRTRAAYGPPVRSPLAPPNAQVRVHKKTKPERVPWLAVKGGNLGIWDSIPLGWPRGEADKWMSGKWIAIARTSTSISRMSGDAVKLQVRMDRSLKEEAEEVFAEMGLDTTTAVRIFFTKVARTRSIPFRLRAEPEFTPEQEARILEAWEESKDPANLSGPFASVEELFEHLDEVVAKDGQAETRVGMGA